MDTEFTNLVWAVSTEKHLDRAHLERNMPLPTDVTDIICFRNFEGSNFFSHSKMAETAKNCHSLYSISPDRGIVEVRFFLK